MLPQIGAKHRAVPARMRTTRTSPPSTVMLHYLPSTAGSSPGAQSCALPQKLHFFSQLEDYSSFSASREATAGIQRAFCDQAVDKRVYRKKTRRWQFLQGNERFSTSAETQGSGTGEEPVGVRGGEGKKSRNTKESFRTHLFEQCQTSSLMQYFLPAL